MKVAVIVCALALLGVASAMSLEHRRDLHQSFMARYNKVYSSPEEEEARFRIFSANLDKIAAMNADEREHATYGINEFADMSADEFRDRMTGFKHTDGPVARVNAKLHEPTDAVQDTDVFNWCDKGACNPVRNQGMCGSCWAFSTIAGLEGQVFKLTGKLPALSEQQLLDCDTVDEACNGGLMDQALTYMAEQAHGVSDTNESYPYHAHKETCHADTAQAGVSNVAGYDMYCNLFDEEHPEPCDEDAMVQTLMDKGPMMVALNAELLQAYFGGIVGTWLPCPGDPDHGVMISGMGVSGKTPYWIVRNSWGSSWGEHGYFRILRGKGTCKINSYVVQAKFTEAP